MPFYFCCKCHALITRDGGNNPKTIVCEECARVPAPSVKEGVKKGQNDDNDKKNVEICPISDWK